MSKLKPDEPGVDEPFLNTTPMKLLSNDADKETTDDEAGMSPDHKVAIQGEYNQLNGSPTAGPTEPVKGRETWDKKIDFLLSVIGFAVDLGNVWRFPYICYRNGGGVFFIPYIIMYVFGGLPLFYLELALGQFQRCGCITVWKRICPMFKGIGFGIVMIASYTAWYYNTVMAWALYYLIDSLINSSVPWGLCGQPWNTNSCVTVENKTMNATLLADRNGTYYSSTEEYFFLKVLQVNVDTGFDDIGMIRWPIALCLVFIFTLVYFSMWKGVKSSGKAVWITATLPYAILCILLVRGLLLDGSLTGIKYYLGLNNENNFDKLNEIRTWTDAAAQIFFSLGPGFGVLLALSSYNKFHNNCYADAMLTSAINCITSFIAGFVVFSVLGHMCYRLDKDMANVADEGPGLVFIAYPEAISTLWGSSFWAICFFLMLITLGLDSTFGGLEAIITAILDEFPILRKKRELFVLGLMVYCFCGALPTTTNNGFFILNYLDQHGAPISIIFIVFCECIALCWFYGIDRFSEDVEKMLGFKPGIYWRYCWTIVSPAFLLTIFIANCATYTFHPNEVFGKVVNLNAPARYFAWVVVGSSLIMIPIFMIQRYVHTSGDRLERFLQMVMPEEKAPIEQTLEVDVEPNKNNIELEMV